MITVLRTPIGHKLATNQLEGSITDASGDALVTTDANHGLSDGDYVYMESNFDSYNGFKYVDSTSYTEFKLKDSENGDYVQYKQDAEITFYISVLNHGWQCVHLPIVYELKSTLFPSNLEEEAYVANTITSFADYQGMTRIVLSHDLSDPTVLAKIKLVGDGPLAGVYQIQVVLNGAEVVIDLDYDATYSFTGYTVEKYYDNYCINVNVYGGLISGHRWEDEKPLRLLGTLKFVPGDDNTTLFSISDFLRGLIKTVNNITLDTLPNNIDFITEFYIGYYESYDVSDNEDITMFESAEILDDFRGVAVNAKNEFKNQYSGHLSDYVTEDGYPARWLTDFDRPVAVVGYFFDLSFLLVYNGIDVVVTIDKRLNGAAVDSETLTITNPGLGVIRVPLEIESGFDEYCVQAATNGVPGSTIAMVIPDLDEWLSLGGSGDVPWTTGVSPTVTIPGVFTDPAVHAEYLYAAYAFVEGTSYSITFDYDRVFNSGFTGQTRLTTLAILDSGFAVQTSTSFTAVTGNNVRTITFTASAGATYIAIKHADKANVTLTINEVTGESFVEAIPSQTLTEQICIDIIDECGTTFNEDARITEGEIIRIIE